MIWSGDRRERNIISTPVVNKTVCFGDGLGDNPYFFLTGPIAIRYTDCRIIRPITASG
jgi:hypothetical protein